MESIDFGKYLKSIRKGKKLTVRQLDLYSGVSHSYISQMEAGKRGIPSPEILKKLSKPLDVEYEDLMKVAGYINEESNESIKLIDKLIKNLVEIMNKDPHIIDQMTLEEKLDFFFAATEDTENLSIVRSEDGVKEFKLGKKTIEINDSTSIDNLDLSYDGMPLTKDEKKEFLAIARGIFSARRDLKGKR